ncbi:MAG: DUF1902 domain-containing protein [Gammaproteobacteria bacterium]|nr:DUF1902 domain-containing protein [Gammaproteobacteria bacterium]
MKYRKYTVESWWDEEAKVWVATSEDVPGLVTEAKTCELLIKKLKVLVPEMLEANGQLPEDDGEDIAFELWSKIAESAPRDNAA